MKFENESMFFKSTPYDKHSSKTSEHNNDALESERSKIENEENYDQILCDRNGDVNLDDHLQRTTGNEDGWNPFKEDSSSMDSSENDDVKAENVESFENDSDLYPETNSCRIVKDICMDDRNDITMADELELSEEVLSEKESKNVSEKSTMPDRGLEQDDDRNDLASDAKSEIIGSESGKLPGDGRSSQTQLGIGESSFSSAAMLARLVNYSGPVTYSGNLSIRSDSSTTSTRSFAFPILQPEWHHNSPVRMAEADRRFFRRHRRWRQGLLCCRF